MPEWEDLLNPEEPLKNRLFFINREKRIDGL
jgi:hypothetical protein